jgi:hypothetical protein
MDAWVRCVSEFAYHIWVSDYVARLGDHPDHLCGCCDPCLVDVW